MDFKIDSNFYHEDLHDIAAYMKQEMAILLVKLEQVELKIEVLGQQQGKLLDYLLRLPGFQIGTFERKKRKQWTADENSRFLCAVMKFGWTRHKEIAAMLPEREASNVSSHLQKMMQKWRRTIQSSAKTASSLRDLRLPNTIPLSLVIKGIAYIRSHLDLPISVEYDHCAAEAAELINNRVTEMAAIEVHSVRFISSSVLMAKTSPTAYEVGARQPGLKNARKWAEQPEYQHRIRQLSNLCQMSHDYTFYVWYVAQENGVENDLICSDLVCGVLQTLAE